MTNQSLLDKYRDVNVDDSWWSDDVIDNFIAEMRPLGIEIDPKNVYWSISYSQGDGASFLCDVDFAQFAKVHKLLEPRQREQVQLEMFGKDPVTVDTSTMIQIYLEAGGELTVVTSRLSSMYCHEGTIMVELCQEDAWDNLMDTSQPLVEAVIDQWDTDLAKELNGMETQVRDILRGYMKDLHSRLVDEYEYLTSDEAVQECLEANEITEEAA